MKVNEQVKRKPSAKAEHFFHKFLLLSLCCVVAQFSVNRTYGRDFGGL